MNQYKIIQRLRKDRVPHLGQSQQCFRLFQLPFQLIIRFQLKKIDEYKIYIIKDYQSNVTNQPPNDYDVLSG